MSYYATPGVYIEEVTGPGVIAGVSTSVTAFIGPAARGSLLTPRRITSFDDFLRIFGADLGDGRYWPHLPPAPRRFCLGYAVQGFFENGGGQAVIVRIGSGRHKRWHGVNGATTPEEVFLVEANSEGTAGNALALALSAHSVSEALQAADRPALANGSVATTKWAGQDVWLTTVLDPSNPAFVIGDRVELQRSTTDFIRAVVTGIRTEGGAAVLTLDRALGTNTGVGPIRVADIAPGQKVFRLKKPSPTVAPGVALLLQGTNAVDGYALVDRVDSAGFVYLRRPPEDAAGQALAAAISIAPTTGATAAGIRSIEFTLTVSESAGGVVLESKSGLSLDSYHPGYVFRTPFERVRVVAPGKVPVTTGIATSMPAALTSAAADAGVDDSPANVGFNDYQEALAVIGDVDDVSIVCVPDAALHPSGALIQQAVRDHCVRLKNRIAVLDTPPTEELTGPGSVLEHRGLVEATGGYATLYHPQVLVAEPLRPGEMRPATPRLIPVPPSGHIAGVMARTDEELGIHYAPANTDVRGVFGLDHILSDRQQGLVNLEGVNILRIFPGEGKVTVWGARTTAPLVETDWTYASVRRLMIYIERSIERGIRWAVFKPNDRPLWQSLQRTIGDFLESVWRSGGLVGRTREEAFRVRIDESLNPPSETALGRLHIEILVAPVRPAEFIIVRIGLWDGGAEVTES